MRLCPNISGSLPNIIRTDAALLLIRMVIPGLLLFQGILLDAQSPRITIHLTDTTVAAVIDQVRSQTEISFIYNHEELDRCPPVTVWVTDGTVEEILEQCLAGTGMTYRKVNEAIILTPLEGEDSSMPRSTGKKGVLRGTVIDRDSRVPLPFATVVVLHTDPVRGSTTDYQGRFRIANLPVGRHTVMVSYVGYEEAMLSEVFVGSSRETDITVAITEKSESIGEVSVSMIKGEPVNQMATVSARSFSVEETKRYAASISDPARMVLVFAGVSGTDDATNEIVIRGNSPNWLLWRIEGVEIPSPNHFSEEGYTSGSVSILSSDMLATSDFYTGAFPAEFGNALSGVFDLRLRNGNSEKHEFSAQAGVLGLDFSAEGPFKKGYNGSYLVNYRYATLSLINKLNIRVSQNALPNYQDLAFKVNLPTKKSGTFSFWSLGGLSDDAEKFVPDIALGDLPEEGYSDFTNTGMYATGMTHTLFPDERSYLRTVISSSYNYSSETYDIMDSLGQLNPYLEDELQNRAFRVSTMYNRKVSHHLTLRAGATLNALHYDYFSSLADSIHILRTYLNETGSTRLIQTYIQSKYRINESFLITAGLHYAFFELSSDHSMEPRIGFQVQLPGNQKLSFGFGSHSKHESLPVYFVEIEAEDGTVSYPNTNLELTRSYHLVAGYEKMLGTDFQFKTEVYYQHIPNLPVPGNPKKYWSPIFGGFYPNDTLSNIGKGRNYGIEFTLQKYYTRGYYGMITASLFDSKYKPADGKWYNTRYNSNYIFNLVGGKEIKWGENKMIGLNAKMIWNGGKRVIPLDLQASIAKGSAVYKNDELYARKTPDYFRIDIGVHLHFFSERSEHILSLDIQNLTNRRNAYAEEYDPETESLVYYPLAGIIPILNYRIEF
ncbi:MAG: carboxypeptidase regulatory-like domain-containing protein [Bacteroidales bacterium]